MQKGDNLMENIFIALGYHVENGQASAINSRQFTDRNAAERQFYLYCAAACVSEYPQDTAMLMTTDGFVIESRTWRHEQAAE
jgi:hypothetical protein